MVAEYSMRGSPLLLGGPHALLMPDTDTRACFTATADLFRKDERIVEAALTAFGER